MSNQQPNQPGPYGSPGGPQPGGPQPTGPYPGGQPGGPQPPYGAGPPPGAPQAPGQPGQPGAWAPPGGSGGPGGPPPGGGGFAGGPEPQKRSRAGLIVILAAVMVLLVGGGAFAVTQWLSTSSGDQPAQALPENAVGYFRVDLNPTGEQKVNAYNLLRKFPSLEGSIGSDDEAPVEKLFNLAKKQGADHLANLNYADDIEPWMGDRAGIALLPSEGEEPKVAVAVQVDDQAAAEEGIKKLSGESDSEIGMAFVGDYAVLAETKDEADRYAKAAEEGSLADNEQFTADMDALGDDGILSMWIDGDQIASMMPAGGEFGMGGMAGMAGMPIQQGRVAAAVRFEADYVELAGVQRGGPKLPESQGGAAQAGTLPDSTAVALSIGGAGSLLENGWPQVEQAMGAMGMGGEVSSMVEMIETQYGIKLPDDAVTLLGEDTSIALDSAGLAESFTSGGVPSIGARFTTDVAAAEPVLDQLLSLAQEGMGAEALPLTKATGDGALSVATNQEYADALAAGGNLGGTEAYTTAVPDADNAQFVLFANLEAFQPLMAEAGPDLAALKAVGISGGLDGDDARFTMRAVIK